MICACIVTSSAVVGSSAIRSLGSHISAAAIITRCLIPPDSSCGNFSYTPSGSAISTSSSIASAAFFSSSSESSLCILSASSTCHPIFLTGLRLVMGSWNTTEMSFPCIFLKCDLSTLSSSTSSNMMLPLFFMSFLERSPAMASADMDLPEPDSPTIPTISPGLTVISKSYTTVSGIIESSISMLRSVTSSIFLKSVSQK